MRQDVSFGWVELRDPRMIKDRERKALLQAARDMSPEQVEGIGRADLFQVHDFENLFAVTFIGAWSFEEPVSIEGLSDLPWVTRNEITELVAPLWRELFPNFDPDPSEESPTEPSGE